jgi:hypothetical protein
MTKLLLTFLAVLCVAPFVIQAQDVSKEAGKYERKSVTYIDALWLMDESAHQLSNEQVGEILDRVKKGISMKRFDYNPVPQSFISDFVSQANALKFPPAAEGAMAQRQPGIPGLGLPAAPDPMLDSITSIMERTVVPKILEVVDLNKEMRAGNLTSEQQRNSFMSDKAKTLGITMEDVDKVMNSAYVFIPLIRRVHEELRDSAYTVSFDAGIIWFRISTKGEKARAVPVVRKFTYSMGPGRLGKSYASSTGMIGYKEFAFRSAVKNSVRNLVVATQEIPEFRLSGQVLETGFMNVGFDLGKNEGVKVDDKYHIVEFSEEADGKISQKNNGWVMVTSVGDSNSKQGYKSKAQTIAGSPFTGAVLSEFPRIPLDLIIKGRMFAFKNDSTHSPFTAATPLFDSLSLTDAYGFGVDIQYDIGRYMGLPQFFFDIGFGMGFGSASGNLNFMPGTAITQPKLTSSQCLAFEGSFVKKFYLGRLALVLQPTFSYQIVSINSDAINDGTDDMYYSATNSNLGFAANVGLEYALGAAVNFGVGAGYQLLGTNKDWTLESKTGSGGSWGNSTTFSNDIGLNYTGLTLQVYFTWSLPSIAFDPMDMVRANMGI